MEKDLYSFKEPVPDKGPTKIEYEQPKFFHRIMANFLDLILFIGGILLLFIPLNAITRNLPDYKAAETLVDGRRNDSGLYTYNESTKTYLTWPSYYDNYASDASGFVKSSKCSLAIDGFIVYIENEIDVATANEIKKSYDEFRLSKEFNGERYFVKNDAGEVISNKESDGGTCKASSEDYYQNIYKPYIMSDCAGYLITKFPDYYNSVTLMSNLFFYMEIPVAITVSAFLIYYVPPLFFRRGRRTLGKALFRIGLVDARVLSPTLPRYTARFFIFFAEIALSLFTFAIPFIVSFSLMAFSKRKQGFPDYMLQLTEIDVSKGKIYFDKYEAIIDRTKDNKEPIDFTPITRE